MPRRTFRGSGGEEIIRTGRFGSGYRKYKNIRVKLDGYSFDSKGEARLYLRHKAEKEAGQIKDFEVHPVFKFPTGSRYTADFKVIQKDGKEVVEDYKSPFTRMETAYRIRIKLLKFFYPEVNFVEV